MTIQETAKIINLLHTAYFHIDRNATVEDLANRIDLWGAVFINYPFEAVFKTANNWIKVNKWLPSVEEIKTASDLYIDLQKKLKEAGSVTALAITEEQERKIEEVMAFVYGC